MRIAEARDLKYIEGIEIIDNVVSKEELEKEIKKFDLVMQYSHTKKIHYFYKKDDISEKMYKNIECFTPYEIVKEFMKMKKYFKEQDYISESILDKKAIDMTLEQFIKADKYEHKEVIKIMDKYFRNIDPREKRRIRNDYDDVREYVYNKYIGNL